MAGTIKSSKPSISSRLSTFPSKNAWHVNEEGVLTERAGPIYMTQTTMISTTTALETGDRMTSTSLTTDERCCEFSDTVTNVIDNTASTVTDVTTTDNKEETFLPVVYVDSYGNLMPIVRSTTAEDVYEGQPLKRNRE